MKRILLPVEDKQFAETQIDFLAAQEFAKDAEFWLMTVVKPLSLQDFGYKIPRAYFETLIQEDRKIAHNFLDELEQKVKGVFRKATIHKVVEYGDPSTEILNRSKEIKPDLIVLSSHGRTGLDKVFLGSVAQAVCNRANASVTIIKPTDTEAKFEKLKVLIPIDEKKFAEEQISFLKHHILPANAEIVLMNVVPTLRVYDYGACIPPSYFEELEQVEERYMATLMDFCEKKIGEHFPNIKIHREKVYGDPKGEILHFAEAESVQWIIIGSHGRSGFDRFFMGSVSQAVCSRAKCTVSVIRPGIEVQDAAQKEDAEVAKV